MKIKVAELIGAELDYWVAKACGLNATLMADIGIVSIADEPQWYRQLANGCQNWAPSTDPAQGHTIIEREEIGIHPPGVSPHGEWEAAVRQHPDMYQATGPTALIAAMRAKVASVYGDEVEA